jgi:hypothetical protein
MYYGSYTFTLIPGKRFAGVDHLKKMAKMLNDKYSVPSEVLGNTTGEVYKHHLVSRFENLAQMEEVQAKLFADEEYLAWFNASEGLVKWQNLTMRLYQIYD